MPRMRVTPSTSQDSVQAALPMAAHEPSSFGEKWASTTGKRIAREYGGQLLDHLVQFESKPFATLAQKAHPFTQGARGYYHVLGMKPQALVIGPNRSIQTYSQLFSKPGFQALNNVQRHNFSTFQLNTQGYVQNTLIGNNLKPIVQPIAQGKVFLGLSRLLGPVLSAIPAITNTVKTYQQTQSVNTTLKVAMKEAIKAVIAWEVGNIGGMLGLLLLPVSGPVGIIASYVSMGLFSAVAYKALH